MMVYSAFDTISISGVSVAVPTQEVALTSYYPHFGQDTVDKIIESTGVKKIHRAQLEQTASDLAFEAAINLQEKGKWKPEEIGILLFVSQKPDYRVPGTSYILHKRLNLPASCICLDLQLACSGFMFGLQAIASLLLQINAPKALLLTGDTSIRTLAPQDRTMVMLFGDSGSAVVLEKDRTAPQLAIGLRTDGNRFKSIITPAGAFRKMDAEKERTAWNDGIERSEYDTHMKGMDVFGFSITDVPLLLKDFLALQSLSNDDIDYYVLHQANQYILKQLGRKLKIPVEKILISLDRFGNNSSNSVPLVLCDHFGDVKDRAIKCIAAGFGAGLSLGCAHITVDTNVIEPIFFTDSYYEDAPCFS